MSDITAFPLCWPNGRPRTLPYQRKYGRFKTSFASARDGLVRWGTGDMMEAAFTGFMALPARAEGSWWEVLGVAFNASAEQAKDAYRALVKKHHPDVGGDAEKFAEVQRAWEQFEKAHL